MQACLTTGSLGIGGALGMTVARTMAITDLPQMVAAFHSLVGLAAVNTSIASYMMHPGGDMVHSVATLLGTFIGAITLTGAQLRVVHLAGSLLGGLHAGLDRNGGCFTKGGKAELCKHTLSR